MLKVSIFYGHPLNIFSQCKTPKTINHRRDHYTRKLNESNVATLATELHCCLWIQKWPLCSWLQWHTGSAPLMASSGERNCELWSFFLNLLNLVLLIHKEGDGFACFRAPTKQQKAPWRCKHYQCFSGKKGLIALESIAPTDTTELFIHVLLSA